MTTIKCAKFAETSNGKQQQKAIYPHRYDQKADVQHAVRFPALTVRRLWGAAPSIFCVLMCVCVFFSCAWINRVVGVAAAPQSAVCSLYTRRGGSRIWVASSNSLELTVSAFSILIYFCLYFIFAPCI